MVGPGWLESTADWTSKQVFLFLSCVQQNANQRDQQGVGIGLAFFFIFRCVDHQEERTGDQAFIFGPLREV